MLLNAFFLLRFKAFLFDYLFILLYLVLLFIINVFLFPSLQEFFIVSPIVAQLTGFLMVTFPISLYFIISDSTIGRRTYGKRKAGIQVVGKDGKTISLLHSGIRTFLKFLPWELSHFLVYRLVLIGNGEVPLSYYLIGGFIYALMLAYILTAIFSKKKQSLYDMLTKTQVIKASVVMKSMKEKMLMIKKFLWMYVPVFIILVITIILLKDIEEGKPIHLTYEVYQLNVNSVKDEVSVVFKAINSTSEKVMFEIPDKSIVTYSLRPVQPNTKLPSRGGSSSPEIKLLDVTLQPGEYLEEIVTFNVDGYPPGEYQLGIEFAGMIHGIPPTKKIIFEVRDN